MIGGGKSDAGCEDGGVETIEALAILDGVDERGEGRKVLQVFQKILGVGGGELFAGGEGLIGDAGEFFPPECLGGFDERGLLGEEAGHLVDIEQVGAGIGEMIAGGVHHRPGNSELTERADRAQLQNQHGDRFVVSRWGDHGAIVVRALCGFVEKGERSMVVALDAGGKIGVLLGLPESSHRSVEFIGFVERAVPLLQKILVRDRVLGGVVGRRTGEAEALVDRLHGKVAEDARAEGFLQFHRGVVLRGDAGAGAFLDEADIVGEAVGFERRDEVRDLRCDGDVAIDSDPQEIDGEENGEGRQRVEGDPVEPPARESEFHDAPLQCGVFIPD